MDKRSDQSPLTALLNLRNPRKVIKTIDNIPSRIIAREDEGRRIREASRPVQPAPIQTAPIQEAPTPWKSEAERVMGKTKDVVNTQPQLAPFIQSKSIQDAYGHAKRLFKSPGFRQRVEDAIPDGGYNFGNIGNYIPKNIGKYTTAVTGGLSKIAPYALPALGALAKSPIKNVGATQPGVPQSSFEYGSQDLSEMLRAKNLLLGKTWMDKSSAAGKVVGKEIAEKVIPSVRKLIRSGAEDTVGAASRRLPSRVAGEVAAGVPDSNKVLRRAPMMPGSPPNVPPTTPAYPVNATPSAPSQIIPSGGGAPPNIPPSTHGGKLVDYITPDEQGGVAGQMTSAMAGFGSGVLDTGARWLRPVARIPASAARIMGGSKRGYDGSGHVIRSGFLRPVTRAADYLADRTTAGANWMHNTGNKWLVNTGRYSYKPGEINTNIVAPSFSNARSDIGKYKLDKHGNPEITGSGNGSRILSGTARLLPRSGDAVLGAGAGAGLASTVASNWAGYDSPITQGLLTMSDYANKAVDKMPWTQYSSPLNYALYNPEKIVEPVLNNKLTYMAGDKIYDYMKEDVIMPRVQRDINNGIIRHDNIISWLRALPEAERNRFIDYLQNYANEEAGGQLNLAELDRYRYRLTPDQRAQQQAYYEQPQPQQQPVPQQQPQQQPVQQQQPTPTLNTSIVNRSPEADNEYEETGWGR